MTLVAPARGGLWRTVEDDASRWEIPHAVAWALLIVPFLAAIAVALTAPFSGLYHWLVDEDHIIEWSQFFAILAASGVFAFAAYLARRSSRRGLALLFAVAALGSFFIAGEEISWGQRILGFGTPAGLEAINRQGETTLHNIGPVQRTVDAGELMAGLYGFLVPVIWALPILRPEVARRLDRLLIPPLCLGVLFFLPFAYRSYRVLFLPLAGSRVTKYGEVPELALYLGILITALVIARALRGELATQDQSGRGPGSGPATTA